MYRHACETIVFRQVLFANIRMFEDPSGSTPVAMNKKSVFQHLSIDYYSATPKYLQLAQAIIKAIGNGNIRKDDMLPSINELSFEFEIARDTAEKGYKYLKSIGVLGSVPGKGYFVKRDQPQTATEDLPALQ